MSTKALVLLAVSLVCATAIVITLLVTRDSGPGYNPFPREDRDGILSP
jgi:hypothetical protein